MIYNRDCNKLIEIIGGVYMRVIQHNKHRSENGNYIRINYVPHMNSYMCYENGEIEEVLDGNRKEDMERLKQWELV